MLEGSTFGFQFTLKTLKKATVIIDHHLSIELPQVLFMAIFNVNSYVGVSGGIRILLLIILYCCLVVTHAIVYPLSTFTS